MNTMEETDFLLPVITRQKGSDVAFVKIVRAKSIEGYSVLAFDEVAAYETASKGAMRSARREIKKILGGREK